MRFLLGFPAILGLLVFHLLEDLINLVNPHVALPNLYILLIRDDTHMASMKLVQFSRPPTHLVHLRPKFFHPFDLGHPILDKPPPHHFVQMITNQLKETTIQGWLLYVIRSFLQVGFRFQYQPINLVWLSFGFFSFSWSLTIISPSSWLYTLVCTVVRKYQEMFFIYNYSHFITQFANNLFYLHNLKT